MTTPPSMRSSVRAAAAPPPPPRPRRWRRFILKVTVSLALILGVGVALWSWFALNYRYSTGQRTGYIRTFAKNGWLCKTWEGEMAVAPVPGVPEQNFRFTMHSDSLAAIVQGATGRQVILTYSEHVAIPTSCFGDTPFYIDAVRAVP